MLPNFSLAQFIKDFRFGFEKNREAIDFIQEHRLWEGFWKFGWVFRLLIFAGVFAGWKLFRILQHWYSAADMSNPIQMGASIGSLFGDFFNEGYSFFFLSGFKYVVLVLVEIIVFHFVRRTLELKTGIQQDFTPKTFIRAEIRMIKIVARNFCYEYILMFLIGTGLGIFGLEWIKHPIFILVQAFFLGFAVIDNYNEIFGMSIKQSARLTLYYPGLSVAVGLTTYFLLLIPILGAILAPFLVGVAATLAFHELREQEGSWRFDWTTIPNKKKKTPSPV